MCESMKAEMLEEREILYIPQTTVISYWKLMGVSTVLGK